MADLFYALIGDRLRAARVRQGLTQQEVGTQVGMTKSSISVMENGRTRPSLQVFAHLCVVLKLDPAQVLDEAMGPCPPDID